MRHYYTDADLDRLVQRVDDLEREYVYAIQDLWWRIADLEKENRILREDLLREDLDYRAEMGL